MSLSPYLHVYDDPVDANAMLSQLSYRPRPMLFNIMSGLWRAQVILILFFCKNKDVTCFTTREK
jgi:hypothetical protein